MPDLSAKEREKLPKKDFALPETRSDTGGEGGYPIEDEAHARSALARVQANGTPQEIAEVRKKVDARYPDMHVEGIPTKRRFHEWIKQPPRERK